MTVYTIDHTTTTSILASIKAAFTAESILTTTHRDTANFLIVTTTRSSRVLSFNAVNTNLRLFSYYGTSYNTGDTINDSVTLQSRANGTGDAGVVVITDDVIVISQRRGSGVTAGFMCGNANDGSTTNLLWGWVFESGVTTNLHNAAARTQQNAMLYSGLSLISTGGLYYYADIPTSDTSGNVLGTGIAGVKQLLKGNVFTAAHEVAGDDVIVPLGFSNSGSLTMPVSLYIVGGNV